MRGWEAGKMGRRKHRSHEGEKVGSWEDALSESKETRRGLISEITASAGIQRRVTVYEGGNPVNMIECLYWKNGKKHYLGLVKNPTEQNELATVGRIFRAQGITGQEVDIHLEFKKPIRGLINLRNKKYFGPGQVFRDRFKPWEGESV